MIKATPEIERLIAEAQESKNIAKEEMCQKIEVLVIQRQKHLFEAKHECIIEVADANCRGISKECKNL